MRVKNSPLYQFLASPFSLSAEALSRMRNPHGYKVNQSHKVKLREGGLGHWPAGHRNKMV